MFTDVSFHLHSSSEPIKSCHMISPQYSHIPHVLIPIYQFILYITPKETEHSLHS